MGSQRNAAARLPAVARTNVMRTFASASDKTSTIKQTVADNKVGGKWCLCLDGWWAGGA